MALAFTLAYGVAVIMLAVGLLVAVVMEFFPSTPVWEYGEVDGQPARRDKKRGNVQFVLWKAGEQGHEADCWHNFDSSWWPKFNGSAR